MKKIICYLCGGFAIFNLVVIFPALMSGAPASWIGGRVISIFIFGGICYLLVQKKKTTLEKPIMVESGNKKEENTTAQNNNEKNSRQESLFTSSATESIAKELFKIATDSITEIIETSGPLNKKGICEAIIFNTNIILNDAVFKQMNYYDNVSNDYLVLLYFLIKEQRNNLEKKELINFINERMKFYLSEYNKLINERQHSSMWVYSTFYLAPLEDEPKPCLDILQVMTFQIGLIRMSVKVNEFLEKKIKTF